MKLNFGRRLVLFVHWLLSLAGFALAAILMISPGFRETVLGLLNDTPTLVYAIAILVVYLLFAVGAVAIIFGGRKRKAERGFIAVDTSETGHARIAVSAVEQMIRQAVRGVPGIVEMKASIVDSDNSITIHADIGILNGTHVPTVTASIQRAIRGYIEQNCGIKVRGVCVSIHYLSEPDSPDGKRRRRKKAKVGMTERYPTSVGNAPTNEPESTPVPEEAPVRPATVEFSEEIAQPEEPVLTFAPAEEPEPVVVPDVAADATETVEETAPSEEPVISEEPVAEPSAETSEPVAEEAAPKKKRGLFGRMFGKRKREAEVSAEPEAAEPTPDGPMTEEAPSEELSMDEISSKETEVGEFAEDAVSDEEAPTEENEADANASDEVIPTENDSPAEDDSSDDDDSEDEDDPRKWDDED